MTPKDTASSRPAFLTPYYWGIPYPTTNSILTVNNNTNCSFNGLIYDRPDALGGTIGLIKTGAGTLSLGANAYFGENRYTGPTEIDAGTLKLDSPAALSQSTLDWNNNAGTLDFGDLTAVTLGGLQGSQDLALVNDADQPLALTVGGNNADTTYSAC